MHIMPCSGPDSIFNSGALIAGIALILIRLGKYLTTILVAQYYFRSEFFCRG
jgi:hypothetical protein